MLTENHQMLTPSLIYRLFPPSVSSCVSFYKNNETSETSALTGHYRRKQHWQRLLIRLVLKTYFLKIKI